MKSWHNYVRIMSYKIDKGKSLEFIHIGLITKFKKLCIFSNMRNYLIYIYKS